VIGRLLTKDPGSAELKFFQAEIFRRRNGQGDQEKALAGFQSVAGQPGVPPTAWRGLGLTALKAKQNDTARRAFRTYLDNVPDADDRDLIRFYLTNLGD
jgi:regulator of sirC expression with transglutaminase-like and TPR domain